MSAGLLARTARLELIAATLDLIAAELAGPDALGALLGVPVPASWPPGEYDRDALQFFTSRLVVGGPAALGWYNWYAISIGADGHRESLVAGAGYLGPPADGVVEIGYSVVPEARGRGFATEIVQALAERALSLEGVRMVIAHTLASNTSSQGVLKRSGFLPAGAGAEPGLLRFERARSNAG
jgi:[ribosomal protein S5]-alanine N-acetyltransferase